MLDVEPNSISFYAISNHPAQPGLKEFLQVWIDDHVMDLGESSALTGRKNQGHMV